MKKILITGKDSYIGTSFENYVNQWPNEYAVDTLDMKDPKWIEKDFSGFDVVFHVAGIAHVSTDPKMEELYYKINCDLTIETCEKAKREGIKQFVFMSSMIVYGDSGHMGTKKVIDKKTKPEPDNFYGKSKLEAEKGIFAFETEKFKVSAIRPPMVYGEGARGNYKKLSKLAQKTLIFPNIANERSMIYIDNICHFIKLIIDYEDHGIFTPQNKKYISTTEMVQLIGSAYGRKIYTIRIFNWLIKVLSKKIDMINKIFGNFVYTWEMSEYKEDYQIYTLKESIWKTEKRK